jgi:hypothetical protein
VYSLLYYENKNQLNKKRKMTTQDNMYRFRLFCQTENKYVTTVIKSPGEPAPPTACPNNISHTIVTSATRLVRTTYSDEVQIFTNDTNFTNQYYYGTNDYIDIKFGDNVVSKDVQHPINMVLFAVHVSSSGANHGDSVQFVMFPDTNLGPISNNLVIGDTKITLMPSQLQYLTEGFYVNLSEGSTTFNGGRIISIDWVNSQIYIENPVTSAFTQGVANLLFSVHVGDLKFFESTEHTLTLGQITAKGGHLPANSVMRFIYNNLSGGQKTIRVTFEYTY